MPLFPGGPPVLPEHLEPGQRARVSDVLAYIHERMRDVSFEGLQVEPEGKDAMIEVPWQNWQNMLQLQRDLAVYLQKIANPE